MNHNEKEGQLKKNLLAVVATPRSCAAGKSLLLVLSSVVALVALATTTSNASDLRTLHPLEPDRFESMDERGEMATTARYSFAEDVGVAFDQRQGKVRLTGSGITNHYTSTLLGANVMVVLLPTPLRGGQVVGPTALQYALPSISPGATSAAYDSGWVSYDEYIQPGTYSVAVMITFQSGGSRYYSDFRNLGQEIFGKTAVLSKNRLAITATWRNPYSGETGIAMPTLLTDEFAFFDFFGKANPEVFVKVLGENDPKNFQFFIGGTTDFEYNVKFDGCGQTLSHAKAPFTADGYVNGAAISKAGCREEFVPSSCPSVGGQWGLSMRGGSCLAADAFIDIKQTGCVISSMAMIPASKGMSAFGLMFEGELSNGGSADLAVSASAGPECVTKGSAKVTFVGNQGSGTYTAFSAGSRCVCSGTISGTLSFTR